MTHVFISGLEEVEKYLGFSTSAGTGFVFLNHQIVTCNSNFFSNFIISISKFYGPYPMVIWLSETITGILFTVKTPMILGPSS